MTYLILSAKTGEVLDPDALPTPYMLADWPSRSGVAVKRNGCWYAVDYPGFRLNKGEKPLKVRIVQKGD